MITCLPPPRLLFDRTGWKFRYRNETDPELAAQKLKDAERNCEILKARAIIRAMIVSGTRTWK